MPEDQSQEAPRLVIPEPCFWHLEAVRDWLGDEDAAAMLRGVDGVETALQLHALSFGDPRPRGGGVERFHAWCCRRRLDCARTFHAMQHSDPLSRRLRWTPGNPDRLGESIRLIRSQVWMAAAMRRPAEAEALLIIHPGYFHRNDEAVTLRTISASLEAVAADAAERRVRLSLETEPDDSWGPRVGADVGRLASVVEAVNAWCEGRGIPPVACVTMDVEHTLVAHWGRHDRARRDMEQYGGLIEHLHVVRPLDLFDGPPPAPGRSGPPTFLRRLLRKSRSPGAHGTIAPPGGDADFEGLVRAALLYTNWRRIGVVNLEVMPGWFYPMSPFLRGARPFQMLASLRLLRRLAADSPVHD